MTLATSGNHWAATLLLRLGDQVRNVEPREVVEATKDLAREIEREKAEGRPMASKIALGRIEVGGAAEAVRGHLSHRRSCGPSS